MFKLLRAEFSRMFASLTFLCGAAACLFLGVLGAFMSVHANGEPFIEECLFSLYPAVLVASALFTSIFIGAEHSHKAIRNKLIIGHKRINVYLSELITAVSGSLIFNAAAMLPWLFTASRAQLGCTEEELALRILTSFCAVAACCSLFTVLLLNITRTPISMAVTVIAAVLLLYAPANNYSVRSRSEKIMNVIPSAHLKRLAQADPRYDKELAGLSELPVCSVGVLTVSTAIGAAIFSKRDLK